MSKGIFYAVSAAVLFGLSTPAAKWLVGQMPPALLAGLLYAGSGLGLAALSLFRHGGEASLTRRDWPWLGGAVLFGGVLAPLALMFGLQRTPGGVASLLLNLEGVLTALLAWFAFRENFDKRIALGMALIVGGGALLSWQGGGQLTWGAGFIALACLCWGLDNNLTQKVSAANPLHIAMTKGLVAGVVNTALALSLGAKLPALPVLGATLAVGFLGYGLSLLLFVLALRHIGTARTGAYFSLAPFVGAVIAIPLLHEPVGAIFFAAALLMGAGVWLHLSENHVHEHRHERLEHAHRHVHDNHHQHEHPPGIDPREPHTHHHVHEPMTHSHPHFPDIHHRHGHSH